MSDSHIERGIREFLKLQRVSGIHDLHVQARQGVAEVWGWADSMFLRQVCIACCRRVTGVRQVIDHLQVAGG